MTSIERFGRPSAYRGVCIVTLLCYLGNVTIQTPGCLFGLLVTAGILVFV